MTAFVTRILLAALVTVIGVAPHATAAQPDRPNVVLILIDDMGWRDLGCTGSDLYRTPHIDALSSSGMRFTQAYSAAPICSPTRASILTGQHPARLGMTDWLPGRRDMPSQILLRPQIATHLPESTTTLAEALKQRGYRTAHIGKWHLGAGEHGPEKNGFDVNIGGTQAGSPPGGYFKFNTPTLKLQPGEYLTDRLTDEAVGFIDQNGKHPFFVYLAHYSVHIPLQPKQEVAARYQAAVKPDAIHTNAIYAAMVESVDNSVGRILQKLDELSLAENTLVIFTSDNGGLSVREGADTPATSNHPLRTGKGYLYEGGIRVPLLIRWPAAAKAGTTCDVPVASADLYSTVIAAAGAAGNPIVDGQTLLPLLRQQDGFQPRALYWHYPHYSNQGSKPSGAVRNGDWKLIEFFEDGRRELYNLREDPSESQDLSAKNRAKADELAVDLARWRQATGARLPTSNPDYVRKAARQ
ncbi:MAG: sulfatase [Gemmataceae bacterium]|nr:sulfatase [Gemmataceae bacterium]